jgi:hypothetical protein
MIIPVCACAFLVWLDYGRVQRVTEVSGTDTEDAVVDATSPTGYAGGKRWLIVPEHNSRSYQWIAETQQMLARHEWRVRRVDYENAPTGREVHAASPYRWWLGLIAWADHALSGRPVGLSVERAALFADPLLHLLLLAGATIFVARQFGAFPAAMLSLGLATVFPLAAAYLPGTPDFYGLAQACALWSVLPLLAGFAGAVPVTGVADGAADTAGTTRRTRRWFFIAGLTGGIGLWVSAANQAPLLAGIALGGMLAAWITRARAGVSPRDASPSPPWRIWALGGAITCLGAYLIEYYPAYLDLRLQVNHPLFGLAWLGVGELLSRLGSWLRREKSPWRTRDTGFLLLATAALAALPVAMVLTKTHAFLAGDPLASRLTNLPNSTVTKNVVAWIVRDGFTATVGVTVLPLLLLAPAGWLLARQKTGIRERTALAIALGPVLVALGFACLQLHWWNMFDAALLALMVSVTAALFTTRDPGRSRWIWAGLAGLVFASGLIRILPALGAAEKNEFTTLEVEGLVERALAHWIADHAPPGGAVILAPPDRTVSLCFYGGLRGLGTPNWENRDGLATTVRIVTATTAEEAQALLGQHGVTQIVLPSWDTDLDEFVRWTLRRPEDSFLNAVQRWALPSWLRPWPYQLPAIAGFEGQSVVILEVTDESDRPAALSRLAEYAVETQQLELAAVAGQTLQRYPADLGALVARAQVEKARGDPEAFTKIFNELLSNLSGGYDRALPWNRRVSLAVVLAQGERPDLAREQVRRCLESLDEPRIRSLTTGALFRLQVLAKAFQLEISDQRLRKLAGQLLPAELRNRL